MSEGCFRALPPRRDFICRFVLKMLDWNEKMAVIGFSVGWLYLIKSIAQNIVIFLGVIGILGMLLVGIILTIILLRKRKKIFAICIFIACIIYIGVLLRVFCPKSWKYPDRLICSMELTDIQRVWGEFDVVGPARGNELDLYQVVGYYIGKDKNGIDQYYFIYEHYYETGDWQHDTWVTKGEKYIDNWYAYFTEGEEPRYFDLEAYIDYYAANDGNIWFLSIYNGDEMKLLDYFGIR